MCGDRGVKHSDGTHTVDAGAWGPAPGGRAQDLQELPKEFRKKALSGWDHSFVLILALSFLLHALLIVYWLGHLPMQAREREAVEIQKRYVDLIVRRQPSAAPVAETLPPGGWEMVPMVVTAPEAVLAPGFERPTAETAGPAAESIVHGAHAAAEERADARARRAAAVQRLGLLRVITAGGSGAVDVAGMTPVLEAADGNVRELGTVLGQLDGLSIPRGEQGGLRGGRVVTSAENLKGGRAARPMGDIEQLVGEVAPLAAASEREVARSSNFERVQSNIALRPPAEQLRGRVRSADEVSRVIRSHHSAIQDCYKAALRTKPDTRGEICLRLWVNPDGEVVDAEIVSSTVGNSELEACVLRKVLQWSDFGFADPEQGVVAYRQTYQFGQ